MDSNSDDNNIFLYFYSPIVEPTIYPFVIMNKFNFDKIIDRNGTYCTKFDGYGQFESDYDYIIPMWIADMDFATPPFIADAIRERLEHPVLGYGIPTDEYYVALQDWFEIRYGFRPERKELVYTPGVVSGIYKLISYFTKEGDGVTILPPVYYPFANVINGSRRKLVEAPLIIRDERFEIDWECLEEALRQSRILLFCHPHNPGGRVWTLEELKRVASIAKKYGVRIISDEIHADLTFRGMQHRPFPSVSDDAREVSVSLMAPSKVFNMPGVIASQLYVPNADIRTDLFAYLEQNGLGHAGCYTFDAVAAAYREGDEWARACMDYVQDNIAYVDDFLRTRIPTIKMIKPEASFLIFLDCRELGFETTEELCDFFIRKAGVFMNDGKMFGTGGAFFMRLNVGTPRSVLQEAMIRIEKAVTQLRK